MSRWSAPPGGRSRSWRLARLLRLHAEGAPRRPGANGAATAAASPARAASARRARSIAATPASLRIGGRWKSADGFQQANGIRCRMVGCRTRDILEELLAEAKNPHRWRYRLGVPVQPPIGNMKVTRRSWPTTGGRSVHTGAADGRGAWTRARVRWSGFQNPKSYWLAGTSAMNHADSTRSGVAAHLVRRRESRSGGVHERRTPPAADADERGRSRARASSPTTARWISMLDFRDGSRADFAIT